jgi:L-2-hydroxyglutarate oxidase LhgO
VYPIPEDGGLGCHATLDLRGQVKFGPDVEWLPSLTNRVSPATVFDYTVNPKRAEQFQTNIRKYFPSLPDGALQPDYSGIRPKLSGPGQPTTDFLIQGEADHGIRGLVNLYGIESPGLTASLAIAKVVQEKLMQQEE